MLYSLPQLLEKLNSPAASPFPVSITFSGVADHYYYHYTKIISSPSNKRSKNGRFIEFEEGDRVGGGGP